jgi:Big-like domain-containing protein
MTATGTFQDGTVLNVTNQVGWSIPPPHGIATISRTGLLTGVSAGSVTVDAKKTGKSGSANGTVY